MVEDLLQQRNALTVDLEEYFQVSNFDAVLRRDSWDRQVSRIEAEAGRLLDLFDEHQVRATFFALGWIAERRPSLIRRIAERGHELACHGYGHELVYELGPGRFREDLRRARGLIEDAAGARVDGYRAPSYSITSRSLWALPILVEEGFRYDSSIFPVRHPRYGIPGFDREPVRLVLPDGHELDEFPLTTLAIGSFTLPLAGGAYLRFIPPSLFRWGWRKLARAGKPGVLYVHPWEIDPRQPRLPVSWKVRLNHYYNLGRVLDRLGSLLRAHRFGTMREVIEGLHASGRVPLRPLPISGGSS